MKGNTSPLTAFVHLVSAGVVVVDADWRGCRRRSTRSPASVVSSRDRSLTAAQRTSRARGGSSRSAAALATVDASQPYHRVSNEVALARMGRRPGPSIRFSMWPRLAQVWWGLNAQQRLPGDPPRWRSCRWRWKTTSTFPSLKTHHRHFRQSFKGASSIAALPDADVPYARMSNVGWRVRLRVQSMPTLSPISPP